MNFEKKCNKIFLKWEGGRGIKGDIELFQKFTRFGDATCHFLTDFVPGDFHWYLISLLFFLWGHYECLQATYSDPYLIFSFTIFSSWHQEPDCLLCLHCRLGHAEALPCLEIDPTPARRIRGKSMARPWQVLQVSNSFHVISQISLF